MISKDLYYWEGEKPPPLTVRYEDDDGELITSIAGATLTAKTAIDAAAEVNVSMTNNDDGTMTIDWPTGTSVFVLAADRDGIMRVDINIVDSPLDYFLTRFSLPVRKR